MQQGAADEGVHGCEAWVHSRTLILHRPGAQCNRVTALHCSLGSRGGGGGSRLRTIHQPLPHRWRATACTACGQTGDCTYYTSPLFPLFVCSEAGVPNCSVSIGQCRTPLGGKGQHTSTGNHPNRCRNVGRMLRMRRYGELWAALSFAHQKQNQKTCSGTPRYAQRSVG